MGGYPDAVTTIADLTARTTEILAGLAALGEAVEDEWQYVTDLGAVWRARLAAVAAARGAEPVDEAAAAAIELLAEEVALIADPHRAIDWLSTLPQAALLAIGETG